MKDLHEIARRSRQSFYQISVSDVSTRNSALLRLAELLEEEKDIISEANQKDLEIAEKEQLASPLLHRLAFSQDKIRQVILGLRVLSSMDDPLNRTMISTEITQGLNLYKVTSPIGVIGVIFESRPDALVQIASLCIKSGNSVLLKGGREALGTNQVLADLVRRALDDSGLPADVAQLLETREDVAEMLKEDTLIDLIIPRGSNSFVRYIMDHSRIPVLGHSEGICHVYIDDCADPDMALKVAVDSKVQNVSVCNAMETLLLHEHIAPLILPRLFAAFSEKHVQLRGDASVCRIIACEAASDKDWSTEYLDYILSVKIVSSLQEAIDHINRFGSHHTDCIVTQDERNAAVFLKQVDSAGVYWNVSTRFADGFVYGLGAEVGIATGKLHARGPMGLDGLTTYKYKLIGSGQTMEEMKNGVQVYTHNRLNENCPV